MMEEYLKPLITIEGQTQEQNQEENRNIDRITGGITADEIENALHLTRWMCLAEIIDALNEKRKRARQIEIPKDTLDNIRSACWNKIVRELWFTLVVEQRAESKRLNEIPTEQHMFVNPRALDEQLMEMGLGGPAEGPNGLLTTDDLFVYKIPKPKGNSTGRRRFSDVIKDLLGMDGLPQTS